MRHLPLILAVLLVAPSLTVQAEALPQAADLPPELAASVQAILRVDDPRWLIERTNLISQPLRPWGADVQRAVGELIANSRRLDGIDLDRPLLFAWRSGPAPFMAVIPIVDRRRFMQHFGFVRHVDRLMLRIDEQDGTIVYSHNTLDGLIQYRLLISEDRAILAASVDECRALAAWDMRPALTAPPLRFMATGAWLAAQPAFDATAREGALPLRLVQRMVEAVFDVEPADRRELLAACEQITVELEERHAGEILLRALAEPRAGTALAAWTARQQNVSSRLLPQVIRPDDWFQMHGHLRWQGELEQLGRDRVEALRGRLGEDLTVDREQDLRGFHALVDRCGGFAVAGRGLIDSAGLQLAALRQLVEQPRAADRLTLQRAVQGFNTPPTGRALLALGDFHAVSGLVAYTSHVQAAGGGGDLHTVSAAGRDHLLKSMANNDQAALVEARTMIASLEDRHAPQGAPALIALRLHLDRVVMAAAMRRGSQMFRPDPLPLDLLLQVIGDGRQLELSLRLPVDQLRDLFDGAGALAD